MTDTSGRPGLASFPAEDVQGSRRKCWQRGPGPHLVSDEVICKPRYGRAACSLYSLPVKAWKRWQEFYLALEARLLSELCPAVAVLKGYRKRAGVLAFPF